MATRAAKRAESEFAVPGLDLQRQRRIEAAHRPLQSGGDLLWVALGSNDEPGVAGGLLQEGIEHGRLLIFRQGFIFAVFHHADDFNPLCRPRL